MPVAEVRTLYESNSSQIAETLRKNADAIERGEFLECDTAVLVLLHDGGDGVQSVDVFGLGQTDIWHSLGVLQAGIAKLTGMVR